MTSTPTLEDIVAVEVETVAASKRAAQEAAYAHQKAVVEAIVRIVKAEAPSAAYAHFAYVSTGQGYDALRFVQLTDAEGTVIPSRFANGRDDTLDNLISQLDSDTVADAFDPDDMGRGVALWLPEEA